MSDLIKRLYDFNSFDYSYFILNNEKKLALSAYEANVLIVILDLFKESKILDIDKIVDKLNDSKKNVENILSNLQEKEFYKTYLAYDDKGIGYENVSLDGFFLKVENILNNKVVDFEDETYSVVQYITKKLNRILTSNEVEIITSLVKDDRYNLSDFKTCIEEQLKTKRVITIKDIANYIGSPTIKKEVDSTPDYVKNFINQMK